jgi:hypothetical protein
VDCLIIYHYYDDAIKLAKLWNLNVTPIVSAFADVCANLVHNILPQSEDPFEYIRHNDSSGEIPVINLRSQLKGRNKSEGKQIHPNDLFSFQSCQPVTLV